MTAACLRSVSDRHGLLSRALHYPRGVFPTQAHCFTMGVHERQGRELHETLQLYAIDAESIDSCSKKHLGVTLGSSSLQEVKASTEESAGAVVAGNSVTSPTASPEAAEQAASVPWTLAGELPLIAIHLHASDGSSVTVAAFAKSLDCRQVPSLSTLTVFLSVVHIKTCVCYH